MNAKRRKQIERIIQTLNDCRDYVEVVRDEESDYFDAMPENLQGGEKGIAAEEAANQMSEALDCIEIAISELEQAIS